MPSQRTTQRRALRALKKEILSVGLERAGFDEAQQRRNSEDTNCRRFRAWYGSEPKVYARMWWDLKESEEITEEHNLDKFLMAMHFCKCYTLEEQMAGTFKLTERTVRKWVWFFLKKLQAQKEKKVSILTTLYPRWRRFHHCPTCRLFLVLFRLCGQEDGIQQTTRTCQTYTLV
jgi:hypothetical protein